MRDRVTTTKRGFEVIDVTFRNMRKQSEILNEIGEDDVSDIQEEELPKSLTPEQIISYFESIIANTEDRQKKKVFSQAIRFIQERDEMRAKLKTYRDKELAQLAGENISDEI